SGAPVSAADLQAAEGLWAVRDGRAGGGVGRQASWKCDVLQHDGERSERRIEAAGVAVRRDPVADAGAARFEVEPDAARTAKAARRQVTAAAAAAPAVLDPRVPRLGSLGSVVGRTGHRPGCEDAMLARGGTLR